MNSTWCSMHWRLSINAVISSHVFNQPTVITELAVHTCFAYAKLSSRYLYFWYSRFTNKETETWKVVWLDKVHTGRKLKSQEVIPGYLMSIFSALITALYWLSVISITVKMHLRQKHQFCQETQNWVWNVMLGNSQAQFLNDILTNLSLHSHVKKQDCSLFISW